MIMKPISCTLLCVLFLVSASEALMSLDKVYAAWYCGDDACLWASEPSQSNAAWLLNRGDGSPTVNVVIFSFINPYSLMQSPSGIPAGFTQSFVNFFTSKGIYVLFSIGGESFSGDWDRALASNPAQLAMNAAAVARKFNVGIEIDYETDGGTYLNQLDTFVRTYRQQIAFEGGNTPSPPSILNVDLGSGTGYLTDLSAKSSGWLNSSLVNWANAMVSGDPNGDNTQYWTQHLDGANWANIPPMNPHLLVGSLYASSQANNCRSYSGTVLPTAVSFAQSKGMRGLSFWAAGCPAPNNCVNDCPGIRQGSQAFL